MPLFCLCLPQLCSDFDGRFWSDVGIAIGREGSSEALILGLVWFGLILHGPEAIFVDVLLHAYLFLDADGLLSGFGILASFQRLVADIQLPVLRVPFLQLDLGYIIMILLAAVQLNLALVTYLKRFSIRVTSDLLLLNLLLVLLALFGGEYAEIQLDPFLLEGCVLEHREEIGPLRVNNGVVDVLL